MEKNDPVLVQWHALASRRFHCNSLGFTYVSSGRAKFDEVALHKPTAGRCGAFGNDQG